ncbi:MAG: hypothetical protein NTZ53_01545 [Cyanobacteria bacterium]|nr:hypothetical protein [Cyanobacteriota bacterium]
MDDSAQNFLIELVGYGQPPYFVALAGLLVAAACGLTFAKVIENRLDGWKQDRLALLPLSRVETIAPAIGIVIGISLFIGSFLQVFGFASGTSLLVSFLLSMLTTGALWVQLVRLMEQVEKGTFKAVDFDNFDEFF